MLSLFVRLIFTLFLLGSAYYQYSPGPFGSGGWWWEKCKAGNADNRGWTNRPLIGRDGPCLHSKWFCNWQLRTRIWIGSILVLYIINSPKFCVIFYYQPFHYIWGGKWSPDPWPVSSLREQNIVKATPSFKCGDGPEGWKRCHQLMELGRGSSEKCLEICKMCPHWPQNLGEK